MPNDDLCYTPATELAALIRDRAISPVELMDAVLSRIERVNPVLNAFVDTDFDRARDAAKAAEATVMRNGSPGPLHGIPVTIKDLAPAEGLKFCAGSHVFADRIATQDAPMVARLKAAGTIVTGKTTTPEFGWKAIGQSPLTGDTRNSWNRDHTTGGSSAGASAAAAAGLGPLHQGGDGAGSIRVPASFCGVFGMKPSFGRVPAVPLANSDSTAASGPITRTVADAALMLAVMAGPHPMDNTSLESAPEDYPGRLRDGVAGLRIGWSPDLGRLRVDPEIAALCESAAQRFAGLGAMLEAPVINLPDPTETIRVMWSAHEGGNYGSRLPQWRDRMDPGLVACIEQGLAWSATDYIRQRKQKLDYNNAVARFFTDYDLLLTPTVSVAALPVGRLNPEGWPQHEWDWFPWAGFSYPFNFSGNPAATVPVGFTTAGLPVGLQIVGRRFADLTVLQAAAAFEAVQPWADAKPDL